MAALLAIIVVAGVKLLRYGDIIAEKSGLSHDWMGLLMGGVLTQAWAIRSERESLPAQSMLSNSMLLYAVLLTFCLQLALLYVPWLNPIFRTEPHSAWMSWPCAWPCLRSCLLVWKSRNGWR